SFPSARVNPKLAISPRSSGRLIFKTSAHCLSPSAPVFTNLTIQATRLPPIRDQTRNYRFGARTPNLQAVPAESVQSCRESDLGMFAQRMAECKRPMRRQFGHQPVRNRLQAFFFIR